MIDVSRQRGVMATRDVLARALAGETPAAADARVLAACDDTKALADVAAKLRDRGFRNVVTYSKKVFIPLTHLCRDVCHGSIRRCR